MLTKTAGLFGILFGTVAGWVELRVVDVQTPALLLFSFALLLGAAFPDGAWRRALMLGLSVPVAHLVAQVTGAVLPYPTPDLPQAFAALVPAFVGSYVGVGVRRLLVAAQAAREQEHPRG